MQNTGMFVLRDRITHQAEVIGVHVNGVPVILHTTN